MPPGATNLEENRYALLSSSPQSKRKKCNKPIEEFPVLPVIITKNDDPKYIVLKSCDNNKPLARFSCFLVHKALNAISKDVKISEMRDGNLLLLAKNKKIAEKFVNTRNLSGICQIEQLNSVKGTIFAPFLNHVSDHEIVEGLEAYGVTSIYRFQRKTDGVLTPTGALLLTFESYKLPEKIDVAWRKISVRPYFPNPMRCKSCQKLGHTLKHCKNLPSCVNCNFPPHPEENCLRIMCANCSGEHPSSSISCPKFQQAKEILKIKTQEKCSISEATKKYRSQTTHSPSLQTYSHVVNTHSQSLFNNNRTIRTTTTNNTNSQPPSNNNSTIRTTTPNNTNFNNRTINSISTALDPHNTNQQDSTYKTITSNHLSTAIRSNTKPTPPINLDTQSSTSSSNSKTFTSNTAYTKQTSSTTYNRRSKYTSSNTPTLTGSDIKNPSSKSSNAQNDKDTNAPTFQYSLCLTSDDDDDEMSPDGNSGNTSHHNDI